MCNSDLKKMFVGFTTLLLAMAAPGDTLVTLEVTAGALYISVPEATALNPAMAGENSITDLGVVTVTDARAGLVGWVASAVTSDLTTLVATVTYTIPADSITYMPNVADPTGTAMVTAASAGTIGTARAVQTADVTGSNSATWTPSVVVAIPADAKPGTYTAAITHSVT